MVASLYRYSFKWLPLFCKTMVPWDTRAEDTRRLLGAPPGAHLTLLQGCNDTQDGGLFLHPPFSSAWAIPGFWSHK